MSCRYCIYASPAGNGLSRCQPRTEFKSADAEGGCVFYSPETRLHEYQGKRLLAEAGIDVPRAKVARTPEEAAKAAREFGYNVVLKAQTFMGRRGKAGLIQKVNSASETLQVAERLLSAKHEGEKVQSILIEERVTVTKEIYLGLAIDVSARQPVFMLSSEGGMEIEEIARTKPSSIARVLIDPLIGLRDFEVRSLLKFANFSDPTVLSNLDRIIRAIYKAFVDYQALLIEINPLCLTSENKLIALDAKVSIDEFAIKESPTLASRIYDEQRVTKPSGVDSHVSYAESNGQVAILANGTSAGMAIMDLLADKGIGFSCFIDIGAVPSIEAVSSALDAAYGNPNTRTVFLSLNGGGLTPLAKVAENVVVYSKSHPLIPDKPLIVRINGTGDAAGLSTLEEVGVEAYTQLSVALDAVVRSATQRVNAK